LEVRLGYGCYFRRWVEGQQLTTQMQTCLKHENLLQTFRDTNGVTSDVARGYPFLDRLRLSWFVTEVPDLPSFMYTPFMVLMRRFLIPVCVGLFKWTMILLVSVLGILILGAAVMSLLGR